MPHTYEFNIAMSCGGCSGAVERALKKLDGIDQQEVSLENQSAKVISSSLTYEQVYEKIFKTGKKINSAKVDGNPVDLPDAATAA